MSDTIGQFGDDVIIQSILKNKFILDYGTMLNISSDGTTCDVQHQVLNIFNGTVLTTPMVTKQVEILYLSSSSISFDTTPINNDPCLILGLKRFINSTKTPMPPPYAPLSPISYERSTIKVVPLSALKSQSGLIFRAKGGKLRLRNNTVSLFKMLNDFETAINTFSGTASQLSLTSAGSTAPSLATAINALLQSMNTSLISVANEISSLLED